MTSEELAAEVESVCKEAVGRILGVGENNYAMPGYGETPERQRFEDESMGDNLLGLEEELLDCINWSAMAILKLRERRANPLWTFCFHKNIVEAADTRNPNRRDDRLTHYHCLDCGDWFPLIGDTDGWAPKAVRIHA